MGRIVRNIKIAPSPEWVVKHLESIGQRSINNIVDATNLVMYNCGQPAHVFDLSKVKDLKLQVRNAKKGEKITLLGGAEKILDETMMVISDDFGNSLDIAGVKGGVYAEVNKDTTDIILECANFDPTSVRKTAQALNIFTDARKRFENDLSPELAPYGMRELSALIYEMCPEAIFEDIVDVYPQKQEQRKLSFSADRISKILGLPVSTDQIKDILKRYNFAYKTNSTEKAGTFEMVVPPMRLDLVIEEDMAEEIGRILGYDKVKGEIPQINFKSKVNEIYEKICSMRNKLLSDGYSEVMTYAFSDKGEVEVMQSASDKKFLRTNLTDGLKESLKLNQINSPLLGMDQIKVFEIGTVFKKAGEEIHVAYNEADKIIEKNLYEFTE
jgi:phenylalanyl-tRNA synthetase beta chain